MQDKKFGFTGYGLEVDERNNILFCKRSTYAKINRESAFCAAQLSICFYQWLYSYTKETTVETLLKELKNTTI